MKTLSFLVAYARKYWRALALTVVAMVLLVGVQLVIPWLIRNLVATVTSGNAMSDSLATITRLALVALAVYLVRGGLQFVRSYMGHVAGWGVVADVRHQIYVHLQRLSLRFYEDKQTGQLMSRVVNDSDMFERLIAHAIPDITVNALTLIGVTAVLLTINWQLMLLSLIPVPFIILSMRAFARYVRPAFVVRQKELGELNATLNDNIAGIREIKAFTREELEAGHVGEHIARYRDALLRALRLMATFHPFVEFTSSLGVILMIYFGGRLVLQQVLPLEDWVAFYLYLDLFYQPIRVLADAWEGVQEALAGAERVSELLNEQPTVVEAPDAMELPSPVQGAIAFHDVSFW